MEVLAIDSARGEEVLPVFSDEGEASTFLRHRGFDRGGWLVRPTRVGELVSVLCGPGASASRVALDPWPGIATMEITDLVSIGRRSFVESLLGRGRSWFDVCCAREAGRAPSIVNF
jgi:hypothetical protein